MFGYLWKLVGISIFLLLGSTLLCMAMPLRPDSSRNLNYAGTRWWFNVSTGIGARAESLEGPVTEIGFRTPPRMSQEELPEWCRHYLRYVGPIAYRRDTFGWPFPWLVRESHIPDPALGPRTVRYGLQTPIGILPSHPDWPELLLSFGTWFALCAVIIVTFYSLRSLLRRRKHRCVRCNYDISRAAGGVCPECGRSIAGGD